AAEYQRLAAELDQRSLRSVGIGAVGRVRERDLRTALRACLRDRQAEAARAAGDQAPLAIEPRHGRTATPRPAPIRVAPRSPARMSVCRTPAPVIAAPAG